MGTIRVAVVTVSDTRGADDDLNGRYLKQRIEEGGHQVALYRIVKDEPKEIEKVLKEVLSHKAQVAVFNGGTGISRRDNTFDVIERKLEKTLTGFGEIFRMLSYEEVGAAAMLSRATAGVIKDTVVIITPGSPNAVTLAWEKLIEPQLQHLAWELTR